jgi:hypothetical protein
VVATAVAQLGHGHLDLLDAVEPEHEIGDVGGEALEQDVLDIGCQVGDPLGDQPVVHGVVELIRTPGVAQVEPDLEVDPQRLGSLTLVWEGADHGHHAQIVDQDSIHGGPSVGRSRSQHAPTGFDSVRGGTTNQGRDVQHT